MQTAFLRSFLTLESFSEHVTGNMTAVVSLTHVCVVVDHTLPIQLQRLAKLKISH